MDIRKLLLGIVYVFQTLYVLALVFSVGIQDFSQNTCAARGPAGPALPGPPHGPRPRCAPRGVLLLVRQCRVAGGFRGRGGAWAAAATPAGSALPALPALRARSLCRSNNGVWTTLGGAPGEPGWPPLRSAADS